MALLITLFFCSYAPCCTVYRCCKSFVCLKTGHKRIDIVTYYAVTILGGKAGCPGVVPFDVRRSDLVNKHIKRGVIISIQFNLIGFNSSSIRFKLN